MSDVKNINGKDIDVNDPNINREHPEPNIFTAFKVGEKVRFRGLQAAGVVLPPFVGILKPAKNAAPGCVQIEDEPKKLIFNADGSLYCHAQYGILLERSK